MERQTAPTPSSRALALQRWEGGRPARQRTTGATRTAAHLAGTQPANLSGASAQGGVNAPASAGCGRGARPPVTPAMEGSPVPRPVLRRAPARSRRDADAARSGPRTGARRDGRRRAPTPGPQGPSARGWRGGSGPSCCLQPGEPHGRLQGATDLHRVCGASRRSREKRQGRNESRCGKPGPRARNEAVAVERAQARETTCPVRWTPRLDGDGSEKGVDARDGCRWRGEPSDEPHERSPARLRWPRERPARRQAGRRRPTFGRVTTGTPSARQPGVELVRVGPKACLAPEGERPQGQDPEGSQDPATQKGRPARETRIGRQVQVVRKDSERGIKGTTRRDGARNDFGHGGRRRWKNWPPTNVGPRVGPTPRLRTGRGAPPNGPRPAGGSDVSSRERPRSRGAHAPGPPDPDTPTGPAAKASPTAPAGGPRSWRRAGKANDPQPAR